MQDGIVALCQKNLTFPKFSLPVVEHFLGLNAKCILHLAYGRPTVDALRALTLCTLNFKNLQSTP